MILDSLRTLCLVYVSSILNGKRLCVNTQRMLTMKDSLQNQCKSEWLHHIQYKVFNTKV